MGEKETLEIVPEFGFQNKPCWYSMKSCLAKQTVDSSFYVPLKHPFQPIFEDQWKSFAEKIQAKLEKQNVYFTEDVVVDLV